MGRFNEWAWRCRDVSGMGAASVLPGQHVNMVGEIRLGEGILEKETNLANENEQTENVQQ